MLAENPLGAGLEGAAVLTKTGDVSTAGANRARPEVSLETGGSPPVTK